MDDEATEVTTDSGIPLARVYDEASVADGLAARLGRPGAPPFTRGPYETMYRERLWTMRQYAGFGDAASTNERFHYLLSQGQTALSVAFDLPTQLGFDSTNPDVEAEVGRVGVAIDTADDMCDVFEGLPIEELSVNFTINATAPIILAFYLVAAERQGVQFHDVAGTLQNDILKEFLARKTFIYPPADSIRLVGDVVEFASKELPRFNGISITGYHAREAGCNAVQEIGLTMASAIAYSNEFVRRGMDFDDFAPRLSFHFSSQLDFFEEASKVRAARRMWNKIATDRFGAQLESSGRLRFFSGCSGATLTAQQPLNNVVRSTLQCLAAVLGGAQSIHVMGYDEALEIPTEESVQLALRTQQIIAHESGVTKVIDPLAGSYFVEWLTDELESRSWQLVDEVEEGGGLVNMLAGGIPQRWIAEAAYQYECEVADGTRTKVGVNSHIDDSAVAPQLFVPDSTAIEKQKARLHRRIEARDPSSVQTTLQDLRHVLVEGANSMPAILECARAGATLGEISDVMRACFGVYQEPQPW